MTHHEFLIARMALYSIYGGRETSGWRDALANRAVGGVEHSAHQFFLAVDFVPHGAVPNQSFEEDAHRLGLLALYENDHYHLQPLDWKAG